MKTFAAIFTVILILTNLAAANENAAPANDSFANATTVILSGSSVGVATNNTDATKEQGEPNHAENAGGKSVWFNFTPAQTMNVRINVMNTNFDTLLAVYTGNSVNNLTLVGWNDNCSNTCDGASTVDLMLTGGTTYRIAVDGANYGSGANSGNFTLAILSLTAPIQDNLETAYDLGTNFTGSIGGTNYNATAEPGEPDHIGGTPAFKTVWYRWKPNGGNYSVDFELKSSIYTVMSVKSSTVQNPTFAQLSHVTVSNQGHGFTDGRHRATFYAETNKYYFIRVDSGTIVSPNGGNFQLKFYLHRINYSFKRNGSEKSAITLYRPSNSVWYTLSALGHPVYNKFGTAGDQPIHGDYDGDGDSDLTVTRHQNGLLYWHIIHPTLSNAYLTYQWGLIGDNPIPGDFDRDGVTDLAVIRKTQNGMIWFARQSSDLAMRAIHWGVNTDKPVLGDFDNDGMTDAVVTRVNGNGQMVWYILKSGFNETSNLYTLPKIIEFGLNGDIPAAQDFDGDRQTDIAVFRPSNGVWYILRSTDGQMQAIQFGVAGDIPQPADYDGDGKASVGVFRPSNGTWYTSTDPNTNYGAVQWGSFGDIPITSISQLAQ